MPQAGDRPLLFDLHDDDVAAAQCERNGLGLDRSWGFVFFIAQGAGDRLYEAEVVKSSQSILSICDEAHRTRNARGVSRGSDIPRCQGCRQFRSSDEAGRNVSCFAHAARMVLMDRFIRAVDMAV